MAVTGAAMVLSTLPALRCGLRRALAACDFTNTIRAGSPLLAVAHLINVIEKQPDVLPLEAGELVTTGTLTAALPINSGETWITELDGIALPGMSVSFEE